MNKKIHKLLTDLTGKFYFVFSIRPLKILAYQNSVTTLELSQSYSDIYKHDHIAGQYGKNISVALTVQLVLNATLSRVTYSKIVIGLVMRVSVHKI